MLGYIRKSRIKREIELIKLQVEKSEKNLINANEKVKAYEASHDVAIRSHKSSIMSRIQHWKYRVVEIENSIKEKKAFIVVLESL